MPRQNRVDPWGRILALDFRGALMGNRGVLHDDDGRIIRDQAGAAWITCALRFKGRRRTLLQPGRWTELFFWDEATALAAGHRPCFECRRDDAVAFRDLFRRVTRDPRAGAPDLDRCLAGERRRPHHTLGSGRLLVMSAPASLPTGAMVLHDGAPHLVTDDGIRRWTTTGYQDPGPAPTAEVALLTPPTTTRIIAAGYQPLIVGS